MMADKAELDRKLDIALAGTFPASDAISTLVADRPVRSRGSRFMTGYVTNIEADTLANDDYRRVLYTGKHLQLVLMTLQPGEEIGLETHDGHDQFIRVESGDGEAVLGGVKHPLSDGTAVVIPSGTEHNIINTSKTEPLRLYTLYGPPEHADGTVHKRKSDDPGH